MSHRLLMGAALAQGRSTVRNVLMSKDIECTAKVLEALGARFTHLGKDVQVQGFNSATRHDNVIACDMHESGTSCRLLMGILGALQGSFYMHGAARLHERPIVNLAQSLQELGVQIHYESHTGFLPLTLKTMGFQQDSVSINIDKSSQYLSGLLLAAPLGAKGLIIYMQGEKVVSWPYVALTLQTLEDFGIKVQVQKKSAQTWQDIDWRVMHEVTPHNIRFVVMSGHYQCGEYVVEGDWSNASYFLAAGAVGQKTLCIQGLRKASLQGDKAILDILTKMGAVYHWEGDNIIIRPSLLTGIDVDMKHCPDLVPTVAMLAAFASGVTSIRNVEHLRIKECDRLQAPATELAKVGVQVEVLDDGLRIHGLGKHPTIPKNTIFSTHNDHRMAMSCALLGLNGQDIIMDDDTVVKKSFPNFWDVWAKV